ncbi:hypothetical protein LLH23_22310, partial [bacterium]|nr:hypothetical protein [bacterium]
QLVRFTAAPPPAVGWAIVLSALRRRGRPASHRVAWSRRQEVIATHRPAQPDQHAWRQPVGAF